MWLTSDPRYNILLRICKPNHHIIIIYMLTTPLLSWQYTKRWGWWWCLRSWVQRLWTVRTSRDTSDCLGPWWAWCISPSGCPWAIQLWRTPLRLSFQQRCAQTQARTDCSRCIGWPPFEKHRGWTDSPTQYNSYVPHCTNQKIIQFSQIIMSDT